ncbi:uncharacterized protein LOC126374369 [Pectinophora gossypiella]|uniref:uncharacterized protein LOC126374369 n=1 Tax=Pectinophora gossypiella TaxID=13191 RepID=UPI00214E329E|nr:uncharacterized protein LOC126374369 [Pectinophora gossypiella]
MTSGGIAPSQDFKDKNNSKLSVEKLANSPYKSFKHLDSSIFKTSKNVTQNQQTEETLYQISKDLVSAILSKLEIQDKITRITREALEAPGKNKGITAIETRRILDFISRTLSGHILSITRASTEPELHRLVYGLGQIAAEVSIVSALKDITYATALSKKQSVDLSLKRKKRAINTTPETTVPPEPLPVPTAFSILLNKTYSAVSTVTTSEKPTKTSVLVQNMPFSIISRNERKPVHVLAPKKYSHPPAKGFLNQTVLDAENVDPETNKTEAILMEKAVNGTHYVTVDTQTLDTQELNAPGLMDDWVEQKDNAYKSALNADVAADIEIDQPESFEDDAVNEKKAKQKLERLEVKAKKAILYAGDVAYLAAASVVAMRRALTASIEVQMSVKYAKNGMSNHQDLMMNLAKTAAQQAGKEAKSATSKSLASERVIKLALKYTAQSHGAKLNHVANRIVMDTLSLATLAKSMAFVSSDIAINSLYQATDVKPPS